MFKRVLIANRGEIASRIISTCRDLDIETVAIYSDDDRSLHYLNQADQAFRVGAGPVSSSYKNAEAILAVAKMANVDCIHPGYGFLAEDQEFAKMCEDIGYTLIGSNSNLIETMGNKLALRKIANEMGVDTVPGSDDLLTDFGKVKKIVKKLDMPIILKPVYGKHGKGVRRVDRVELLEKAFVATQIEAKVAFGDNSIIVEKAIEGARHIEIPVLRDKKGNLLVLPDIDCSIQRRYQKILAESPAASLDDRVRKYLKTSAAAIAEKINLQGVATFEFLVAESNQIYFLEANARLTVEHSITEMITGLDLIKQQFLVSAGEPIELYGKEIKGRGAAIQARIYAEDPEFYQPHPGVVDDIFIPVGPNVRNELVAHSGWSIPIHYDHMLAKMTVSGRSRREVVKRMTQLFKDYMFSGIVTNIPLFKQIFASKEIINSKYNLDFLRDNFVFKKATPPDDYKLAMVISSAIKVYQKETLTRGEVPLENAEPISTWRNQTGTGRL